MFSVFVLNILDKLEQNKYTYFRNQLNHRGTDMLTLWRRQHCCCLERNKVGGGEVEGERADGDRREMMEG